MKIEKFVKKSSGMYKLFLANDEVIELHEDLILKEDLLLKRERETSERLPVIYD